MAERSLLCPDCHHPWPSHGPAGTSAGCWALKCPCTEPRTWPQCTGCIDNGIILDRYRGAFHICTCEAGQTVRNEIKQGEADILAGRLTRWGDLQRTEEPPR